MRAKLYLFVFLILCEVISAITLAQPAKASPWIFPGFTAGARSGMEPRAGFDLSVLKRVGEGDGFVGYGGIAGISSLSPYEYYVGLAGGGAYMLSAWAEFTVNFVNSEYTGVRALGAVGLGIMPYIAVGYDKRPDSLYVEAGITGKIPIPH
jgi:hypothetical protein